MKKTTSALMKRILFTLGVLALYRLGSVLPVPGIDTTLMNAVMSGSSVFAVMNMIGGGALERMSLFALGVSPYITASIIIELLSMDVVPALSEWRKGGNPGRNKLSNATRYLGLALAATQAFGIVRTLDRQYSVLVKPGIASYELSLCICRAHCRHRNAVLAGRSDHRARNRQWNVYDHLCRYCF